MKKNRIIIVRIVLTILLVIVASLMKNEYLKTALFIFSYLLIGFDILIEAIENITKGKVLDENFLMSIATIGAIILNEMPEAIAVMLFYQIGETFQRYAVGKSRNSIKSLMDIRPDYANIKINEEIKVVNPEEVNIGDIIVVKPGEKIPLDGLVIDGNSMIDTKAITGESVPKRVNSGENVYSGSINLSSLITIKVEKNFENSTVNKILELVENASNKKAKSEKFITKFARYYTPAVVIFALLLAICPPIITGVFDFSNWISRALIFLVISCPCALVISIPLSFFGGIGGASKQGILIKGSTFLEDLSKAKIAVFDKTGTLTKGVFKIQKVYTNNFDKDELIKIAAYAENYSNHPIALSIKEEYKNDIEENKISDFEEISGKGIRVKVFNKEVLIGNSKLLKNNNIEFEETEDVGTIVYLAIENKYAGYILISDELKEDSKKAIKDLKKNKIEKTIMLTGDSEKIAKDISSKLGIDKYYSELLPMDKVSKLEDLIKEKNKNEKLLFVGDGINDSPVLARADIGIAMGGIGSDAAIEAADIVIMTDEISKLSKAIDISRKTLKIVKQNIIFALSVKLIILILGAFGLATMWEAVFADVGVSVIAIINSMRALK